VVASADVHRGSAVLARAVLAGAVLAGGEPAEYCVHAGSARRGGHEGAVREREV